MHFIYTQEKLNYEEVSLRNNQNTNCYRIHAFNFYLMNNFYYTISDFINYFAKFRDNINCVRPRGNIRFNCRHLCNLILFYNREMLKKFVVGSLLEYIPSWLTPRKYSELTQFKKIFRVGSLLENIPS